MKTIKSLNNRQLEHLEQRIETKFEFGEIPCRRYKRLLVWIAAEHLRRVGIDSKGLKLQGKKP